jgi:nicotinamide riboside transporter PnuC
MQGIEAAIVVLALIGSALNAHQKAEGFIFWGGANSLGIWLFYEQGLLGMVFLYIVYLCICAYGIWKWTR